MIAIRNGGHDREMGETSQTRVREVYENRGLRCFKVNAIQLVEEYLETGFEVDSDRFGDKNSKIGKNQRVWYGHFIDRDITLKIVQTERVLDRVYVQYYIQNPDNDPDVKELRKALNDAGLHIKRVRSYKGKH